jgi:hypothetical protein
MADFLQPLGFDLTDALAGDVEALADFFEGAGLAVLEAEAEFEHFALALGQAAEGSRELGSENHAGCGSPDPVDWLLGSWW